MRCLSKFDDRSSLYNINGMSFCETSFSETSLDVMSHNQSINSFKFILKSSSDEFLFVENDSSRTRVDFRFRFRFVRFFFSGAIVSLRVSSLAIFDERIKLFDLFLQRQHLELEGAHLDGVLLVNGRSGSNLKGFFFSFVSFSFVFFICFFHYLFFIH
jgi:hypothetical protein